MSKKQIQIKTKDTNATIKVKSGSNLRTMLLGAMVALTFIIYGNSIFNDYALDDMIVLSQNEFVQKGISGVKDIMTTDLFAGYTPTKNAKVAGGRYRPLSLVTFALEYQFLGKSPHFSHFINVLLFAICGLLVFVFTEKLFKNSHLKYFDNSAIPIITALLFIAHPIHTEVVANIKGRDELLSLLFSILTTIYFLNYLDKGRKMKDLAIGIVCFFLALLSKENSITFLIIIPLTLYFFRKPDFKSYATILLPLALTGIVYLVMRGKFAAGTINEEVTNLLNNPFYGASMVEKFATIIYTIGYYFILLLMPINLSCDYDYNQIPIVTFSNIGVIVSLIIIIGLAVIVVTQIRQRSLISYCILLFGISFILVSNILFPIGTMISERFVFIPSIGFCMVLAYFINKTVSKTNLAKGKSEPLSMLVKSGTTLTIVAVLLVLYSIRTVARNTDWKDNLSLFSADVKTCPNSANLNKDIGSTIFDIEQNSVNKKNQTDSFNIAKGYLRRAVEIYPKFANADAILGVIYYRLDNYDSAAFYQKMGYSISPDNIDLCYNYGKTLDKLNRYDEAIKVLNHAIELDPKHEGVYFNLALSYTNKGDNEKGLYYFLKVIEVNPKRGDAFYYAGLIYKNKHDVTKAEQYLSQAKALGFSRN